MRLSRAPQAMVRKGVQLVRSAGRMPQMIVNPRFSRSYFPSEDRKSKLRICFDLFWWLLRYRDLNIYYYVYGLDRRYGANMNDYLPYHMFRNIRNSTNLHPADSTGCNYVCLLRDKFVFSQFVASLGIPTPKNLAICTRDSVTWLAHATTAPLGALLQNPDLHLDAFCKRLAGIRGKGAFPLRLRNGTLFINEEAITLEQLKARLDGRYLIQEYVQQHPKMSALHPSSLNTIRLVTFHTGGSVQAFSAALRMGTSGRSVDNWAAGGILVGVDLESGRLHEEGVYKPGYGGRVRVHPQTHILFSSFDIPHFHDAVELAMRLHSYLYGIHSVGWDIAITEAGPVIIEGNDDWDGVIPMTLEKNFKQRFLAMYRA